ncbi:MAG TPA: flagellin, partial [Limnochordales bacterium]|nr:flagellin [Limnochordales bacterium]
RGLNQAIRNAQDGISLIQTAEGALQETHAILQRMRELAVQAANDTYTEEDRAEIQKEIDQLAAELTRIADTTEFNTQNLLGGGFSGTFHIGANEGQKIVLDINDMSAEALKVARTVELTQTTTTVHGVGGQTVLQDPDDNIVAVQVGSEWYAVDDVAPSADNTSLVVRDGAEALTFVEEDGNYFIVDSALGGIDVSTQDAADKAITIINAAIETVSAERSKLGAYQNRLEHTIANLGVSAENLQAAESRIRDVDMAQEMMNFTKFQILQQASTAMLAQANLAPQSVLQLLG